MTIDEFNTWYAKTFAPSFLSVFKWLQNESPDTAATLRSWYDQLKHLTVVQLNDALAIVQSGAEDLGQWQDIHRTLARIARMRSSDGLGGRTIRALKLAETIRYGASRGCPINHLTVSGVIGFLTRDDASQRERQVGQDLNSWVTLNKPRAYSND